jgi:DNA-binding CsgD family transcriptional regulator/tetratricopeptide (TPR) repeat protein
MTTNLLERDHFILTLDTLLLQAASGLGRTVLVSGEAGIGKTSVVEHFLAQHRSALRPLLGSCEALFTPRPLGPLYDLAQQAQTPLRAVLERGANRATLFAAVLDELAYGPLPTIVVIEDIHWADEATLDLIKFLARRIQRMPALLILSYRDDELGKGHPLHLVLGDLPARDVTRLRLPPLSERAVAALAQQAGRPVEDLYAITGGNPFFLTEVLASAAAGVPTSVRDAVLTQVARLSQEARSLLELVAVVPTKMELGMLEAMRAAERRALEECCAVGMLHLEGTLVGYRHELARQAVESALVPMRRRALHAEVLHTLLAHGIDQVPLAQLVHHAVQAEEGTLALRFAPAAARQATAQGAHREAEAHYMTALRYADGVDDEQRAILLDGVSYERYLTGHIPEAVPPREAALAIWRALDRKEQVGCNLRHLSRFNWYLGRVAEAEQYGLEAVALLETLPPGSELAMAYSNMAHLLMLLSHNVQAMAWGERAIALAECLHDVETLCYTLNTVGSALLNEGDDRGWAQLERSLALALEHGFDEHVSRAYANFVTTKIECRDYASAAEYCQQGLVYCAEHDLGSFAHCLRGHQAAIHLALGDWASADEDATAILSVPWASGTNRIPALIILGILRARRGDPGVEEVLDEALTFTRSLGDIQCIAPVAVARAEWRWLQGDIDQCHTEAVVAFQLASQCNRPWYVGEMALWLWHSGGLHDASVEIAPPFAAQIAGDWQAAATLWEQIGCPYEQALALMDGDEAAQRRALVILERLGARPAAEIVRRQLRLAGVRGLPRGPRSTTRENPYQLTHRQLEILLLLAEGLHNPEIAERIATTPKTVEHHVSAVLAKLEVRTRAEAVRVASQIGLLP